MLHFTNSISPKLNSNRSNKFIKEAQSVSEQIYKFHLPISAYRGLHLTHSGVCMPQKSKPLLLYSSLHKPKVFLTEAYLSLIWVAGGLIKNDGVLPKIPHFAYSGIKPYMSLSFGLNATTKRWKLSHRCFCRTLAKVRFHSYCLKF